MLSCRLTIKIKDYFPKVTSIPYTNYICLFTCGEYQGQIPFLPDETKFLQHQLKNISTDIKYKVLILDFNDMTLIGMCEMNIAYKVLSRILPQNGFIQEQQKKLIIDTKTKRKLFGTVINSGDIYLNIYTEVFLISKNFNDQKIKNSKLKKNHPMINTPKCYIKYNFALNKSDFSPKSSKNNKSTMVNSNSEKQTLNLSKQDKDKDVKSKITFSESCISHHSKTIIDDSLLKIVKDISKKPKQYKPEEKRINKFFNKKKDITEEGVHFKSELDGRKLFLTPEESIRIQNLLDSDIAMSFDECPPASADKNYLKNSIERTIRWAKRGKAVFNNPNQNLFGIKKEMLLFQLILVTMK